MITVKTNIKSPLEKVWNAYTTPQDIIQWNHASEEWHCPSVNLQLHEGGTFCYRMEAKDGSVGFDFEGKFTRVVNLKLIEYAMGNRNARVVFDEQKNRVEVTVTFDSDGTVSEEMQRAGWQAILDNFRCHVLSKL